MDLPRNLRFVLDVTIVLVLFLALIAISPALRYTLLNAFGTADATIKVVDSQAGLPIIDARVTIDQQTYDITNFPSNNYFDMSSNTTSYSTYRLVINEMTRGIKNINNAAIGGWYLFNSGNQVPYAPSSQNQNIITPINKINPASPRVESWTDSTGTYYAICSNFYSGTTNNYLPSLPSAPFANNNNYIWSTLRDYNLYLACSDITQPLNKCIEEDQKSDSMITSYVGTTKSYAL
jgi:hypothetical protein